MNKVKLLYFSLGSDLFSFNSISLIKLVTRSWHIKIIMNKQTSTMMNKVVSLIVNSYI